MSIATVFVTLLIAADSPEYEIISFRQGSHAVQRYYCPDSQSLRAEILSPLASTDCMDITAECVAYPVEFDCTDDFGAVL